MTGRVISALIVVLGLLCGARCEAGDFEAELLFEVDHPDGWPRGWSGGPRGTIHLDTLDADKGSWSVRLERDATSAESFTALTRSLPVDFLGRRVELAGWLRTEDVTGFAGLWVREDGSAGVLRFDNMAAKQLQGTTGWTKYRIKLPLDARARDLVFGALLWGEGKVWVDDLVLLVDGKPVMEAPRRERAGTVFDEDREFEEGSGVEIAALTPVQVEHLTLLGKVWGFLKYHHPRITGGEEHWDYALFRVLPAVLAANEAGFRAALRRWIAELGDPPACNPCAKPPGENAHLVPDLDWIRDVDGLGEELSAYLQAVYRNRHALGPQFYVSLAEGVRNPVFNEAVYFPEPDAGYRILALFRFWNIVAYWSPYRDVIGEDWDGVLAEFLPRLVEAARPDAYRLEMIALLTRMNDTHTNLWGALEGQPPGGGCRVAAEVRFAEGVPVVDAFPDSVLGTETGLRVGDVVLAVDEEPVDALVAAWAPYYPASNEPARLRDIARGLLRGDCGPCRLRVRRGGDVLDLEPERVPSADLNPWSTRRHDLPGETFRMLSDEVAYLKLSSVESKRAAEYVKRAAGAKGWVLDLRNYPSEFMVFTLGKHLVSRPTPFARFTRADLANPGAFLWDEEPVSLRPGPRKPRFGGQIVILVDEISQSQAEYTTMAFRSVPGAVVVGSTTAGVDGNVSPFPLPGGANTMISGIGVFYPDRTPTQRVGIVPDVVVTPTVEGIAAGRDEVLEQALRIILGDAVLEAEIRRLAQR